MERLNKNERKALEAIKKTCDDLDGYLFTRLEDAVHALVEVFGDGYKAGGYITSLVRKGFIDVEEDDGYGVGMWVNA